MSRTEVGKKHDYKILEESGFMGALLKHVIRVDLGFLGIVGDYSKHDIMIPYKNSKLKKIIATQKEENRFIAGIRALIENVIGRAKKYWIIANKYRNRTTGDFRTVKNNMKQYETKDNASSLLIMQS